MKRKSDPIPSNVSRAIEGTLRRLAPWEGKAEDLLALLNADAPGELKANPAWPQSASRLGVMLRQLARGGKTRHWRIGVRFIRKRYQGSDNPLKLVSLHGDGVPTPGRVHKAKKPVTVTNGDKPLPAIPLAHYAPATETPAQTPQPTPPTDPVAAKLQTPLEPLPRCQARKRGSGGEQCGQYARKGKRVCFVHGAGKKDSPPPGGRPTVRAMLSGSRMAELRKRVMEYERDIDDSDEELTNMRAALLFQIDRLETEEDPEAQGVIVERVMGHSHRIIRAIKERAETSAKRAEARALEGALLVVTAVRNIVWELLDDATLDLFEQRLRREVLAPRQLMLPERTERR